MAIEMPMQKEQTGGKRRALGKGLDSLLPQTRPAAETAAAVGAAPTADGRAFEIALDKIDRNPYQTRTQFDEQLLGELANSIREVGVIQPVLVRSLDGGRYQLIAG